MNDSDDFQILQVEEPSRSLSLKSSTKSISKRPGITKREPLTRVKSNQKSNWVSSSFDDFFQIQSRSSPLSAEDGNDGQDVNMDIGLSRNSEGLKGHQISTSGNAGCSKLTRTTSNTPKVMDEVWVEQYAPKNKAELAVQPKKVDEVWNWLSAQLRSSVIKQTGAAILVLTGPPGSGKTATLRLLCSINNLQLADWSDQSVLGATEVGSGGAGVREETRFEDFLFRSDRYRCLEDDNLDNDQRGKVLLIEDFPTLYGENPRPLHALLTRHVRQGRCPLVLIISDTQSYEFSERWLFPRDLQHQLGCSSVNFNPVCHTLLVKTLTRIAQDQCKKLHLRTPSKQIIDSLATESHGDIRTAINQLQFALSDESGTMKTGATKAIGSRDTTMVLFQALGKVLYCKRSTDPKELEAHKTISPLPSHLSHHARPPPAFCPEEILEHTRLPAHTFVSFLHENSPDFLSDVDQLAQAADWFSWTDAICSRWHIDLSLDNLYTGSVAIRGLMHSHDPSAPTEGEGKRKWRPMRKSLVRDTAVKATSRRVDALRLMETRLPHSVGLTEAITERLPYMLRLRACLRWSLAERNTVNNLCFFNRYRGNINAYAQLVDRDCGFNEHDTVQEDSNPQSSSDVAPLSASSISSNRKGSGWRDTTGSGNRWRQWGSTGEDTKDKEEWEFCLDPEENVQIDDFED